MPKVIQQYVSRKNPRVYLQERSNSKFLQALTFLNGKKRQKSMGTEDLGTAEKAAEKWFKDLKRTEQGEAIARLGEVPTMGQLYDSWEKESMSSKKLAWIQMKWSPIKEFWRTIRVTDINAATFKDFYRWRRTGSTRTGTKLKNHTLHKDVILLRQLLKYAHEEEHIDALPPIPKIGSIEVNPRPWLTEQEWEHLCHVSEQRIEEASNNIRLYEQRIELDDQIRWMVATMMRVGEMVGSDGHDPLRFRDCRLEKNKSGEQILKCEVQGKRGGRTVVGRRAAARIYQQRLKNANKDMKAFIFPVHHREAFTELLKAAELHVDPRTRFERNFKSLRATAISLAVLRGALSPNLLMIARNAGTSVAMIDAYYSKRLSAEMGKDDLTSQQDDE
jgi:hypothetical protein